MVLNLNLAKIKPPSKNKIFLKSRSVEETHSVGQILARQLRQGMVVALCGNIGSGKTTMVRGIIQGLGVFAPITSPTYTIMNLYSGDIDIYHFDFYRLTSNSDLIDLGLDEYFYSDGLSLIEWPDRIMEQIPEQAIWVNIEYQKSMMVNERNIYIISDLINDIHLNKFRDYAIKKINDY